MRIAFKILTCMIRFGGNKSACQRGPTEHPAIEEWQGYYGKSR